MAGQIYVTTTEEKGEARLQKPVWKEIFSQKWVKSSHTGPGDTQRIQEKYLWMAISPSLVPSLDGTFFALRLIWNISLETGVISTSKL